MCIKLSSRNVPKRVNINNRRRVVLRGVKKLPLFSIILCERTNGKMAPPRRSRRLEARSISTTPATTASPIFSSKTSLVSETPVTSDEDENNSMNKTKVARPSRLRETATRVTSRKKRELEDVEVTDQLPPASKKRNVSASKANVVVETASRPARNRKVHKIYFCHLL